MNKQEVIVSLKEVIESLQVMGFETDSVFKTDQVRAWLEVCNTLSEVKPDWSIYKPGASVAQMACDAIRELANKPTPTHKGDNTLGQLIYYGVDCGFGNKQIIDQAEVSGFVIDDSIIDMVEDLVCTEINYFYKEGRNQAFVLECAEIDRLREILAHHHPIRSMKLDFTSTGKENGNNYEVFCTLYVEMMDGTVKTFNLAS